MTPSKGPDLDALLTHVGWVRGLALQLCADVHGAEDAAQTTWTSALRQPPREVKSAKGFLARTLRNVLQMDRRAAQRRQQRERAVASALDATAPDAAELAARAELHRVLVSLVLALPEPRRELVLRHYFEGEDVNALARRSQCSPDAVRAHLRRARAWLRGELERASGQGKCNFGVLLASLQAVPAPAASIAMAAVATGASVMQWKLVLGAAALVAAVLVFVPLTSTPEAEAPAAVHPPAALADRGSLSPVPTADPVERVPLPVAATMPVHFQLVGLHPALPWTSKVTVRAAGRDAAGPHEHDSEVDVAAGACSTALPAWAHACESLQLKITAADPWYLPVDQESGGEVQAGSASIRVAVTPASVVMGSVVNEARRPATARVLVFAATVGRPRESTLASADTDSEGSYRLRVPAGAEFLVAAVPMSKSSDAEANLLPAAAAASTTSNPVAQLDALVLRAPSAVKGRVLWADGRPVAEAAVELRPSGWQRLEPKLRLGWIAGDQVAFERRATTDAYGQFELPAAAGSAASLLVLRVGRYLTGPGPDMMRTVVAPQEVEFRLARSPVLFRVLRNGEATGRARVEWKPGTNFTGNYATDEHGELALLAPAGKLSVRAFSIDESERSEWLEFANSPPGSVDLHLMPVDSAPVVVQFETAVPLSWVSFLWHALDAGATSSSFGVAPDAVEHKCHMRVRAGRYRVEVREPSGFLLANMREVEVPGTGLQLALSLPFGGRLRIAVTDAAERLVAGSCRLIGSDHVELLPSFDATAAGGKAAGGTPGRVLDVGPSETRDALPPGSYEVVLDLGVHGVHRRTVEVKAREFTEVRIRLP